MLSDSTTVQFKVFPSQLGWMGLVGRGEVLCGLRFGARSAGVMERDLFKDFGDLSLQKSRSGDWLDDLAERLQAYSAGEMDDFLDVEVDSARQSPFAGRVVHHCRRIVPGDTLSYGQLAERAGSPGAARAVGNIMAKNQFPLIVPCHRVVTADERLGGYSATGGVRTKQRLLDLESAGSASLIA